MHLRSKESIIRYLRGFDSTREVEYYPFIHYPVDANIKAMSNSSHIRL
ncbi:hypothetical protein RchiOBHm_Chr7g0228311 [Rosa chinensis]|uniref:Uncharacterized protein n=1 Tax=Rosa chinensis TaxID=74649 RepID=A0A2P6PEV3_ROSCH|nr:hypothetical protein RchiOBHm_Chr7g0228311 [Rosa chinensis]